MKEYEAVCGAAFEDLSSEEMQQYDGGASIATLSTTTWLCIGASLIISGGLTISAAVLSKNLK